MNDATDVDPGTGDILGLPSPEQPKPTDEEEAA